MAKKEIVRDVRWALKHKPVEGIPRFSLVKNYTCENYEMTSLNGITLMPNLEHLSAYSNKIESLSELESLASLKYLNVNSNRFYQNEGFESLKKLTQLEELHIANNDIDNLEGLESLVNLKTLNIASNKIVDLTPIINLPNIEILYISNNQIQSLAGVGNFPNLKQLRCDNNAFKHPFPGKNAVEMAQEIKNNPLYGSIKLNKFMKIGMFDHLNSFDDFSSNVNEKNLPDWFEGIEFGKKRNDVGDVGKKLNKSSRDKIEALEKKRTKILAKWENDKNLKVSVRKRVMSPNTQVGAKEALELLDQAISNVRRRGETLGIIIYA